MMRHWKFLREVPNSASGLPVPQTACCCLWQYRWNWLLRGWVLVTLLPGMGVCHRIGDRSISLPTANSGLGGQIKSP
jgi:hypothetical protein